jgi:hypothetical protein
MKPERVRFASLSHGLDGRCFSVFFLKKEKELSCRKYRKKNRKKNRKKEAAVKGFGVGVGFPVYCLSGPNRLILKGFFRLLSHFTPIISHFTPTHLA